MRLALAIVLVLICTPLLWLCLTAFEPEVVLYQAERIADNRPYCIAVTNGGVEYNAVRNRSELTFHALKVRLQSGGSGYYSLFADTYYALLILKNPDDRFEIKNWSKLYLNFQSDVGPTQSSIYHKDPARFCKPVVDFSNSIPY